jgi:hypothetical protein
MKVEFLTDMAIALLPGEPLDALWLCSAHAGIAGIEALAGLIGTAARCRVLLAYTPRTEWQALQRLLDLGTEVLLLPAPADGRLYPRAIYAQAEAGEAWTLAGSLDLTGGWEVAGPEAAIRVRGSVSLPVMAEARAYFNNLTAGATLLTPELLEGIRGLQEPISRVAAAAMAASGAVAGGGPAGLGRQVAPLFEYISSARMESSYRLVILALMLQAPGGRLDQMELGVRFLQFYQLLALRGAAPERQGLAMSQAQGMTPRRAMGIVREAAEAMGLVHRVGTELLLSRAVWGALTPAARVRARYAAVERLRAYYRAEVGHAPDVSALLLGTVAGNEGLTLEA